MRFSRIICPLLVSLALWKSPVVAAEPGHSEIVGKTVDESGSPLAGVRVWNVRGGRATSVSSGSDGGFALTLGSASYRYEMVLAATAADELMAMADFDDIDEATVNLRAEITLVLKPSRKVRVVVKDGAGIPVEGASAAVESYHTVIAKGETERTGLCTLAYPVDAPILHVIAMKPGAGLDYLDNSAGKKWKDAKLLPEEVPMVLGGAITVHVKAVDSGEQPVAGISMIPWTIEKAGRGTEINVGDGFDLARTTNQEGIATFDYLPKDTANPVIFQLVSQGWHLPNEPIWKADDKAPPVIAANLLRRGKLRGVVLFPDGQPAPGILLQAEGRGNTNDYYRDFTRTRSDGSFEFLPYAEQSYLISVTDKQWAAQSITSLVVREDSVRSDLMMTLSKGTIVSGIVKDKLTGAAVPETTVTVIEQGAPIDGRQLKGNPEALGSPCAQLVRWTKTNAEGRYRIRLGKGAYTIGADRNQSKLIVGGEKQIERDFNILPRQ